MLQSPLDGRILVRYCMDCETSVSLCTFITNFTDLNELSFTDILLLENFEPWYFYRTCKLFFASLLSLLIGNFFRESGRLLQGGLAGRSALHRASPLSR